MQRNPRQTDGAEHQDGDDRGDREFERRYSIACHGRRATVAAIATSTMTKTSGGSCATALLMRFANR
jgi:hypothetical protein